MDSENESFSLDEGQVSARIMDGSIHLKVVTTYGDPVELNAEEAKVLADALLRFARVIGP